MAGGNPRNRNAWNLESETLEPLRQKDEKQRKYRAVQTLGTLPCNRTDAPFPTHLSRPPDRAVRPTPNHTLLTVLYKYARLERVGPPLPYLPGKPQMTNRPKPQIRVSARLASAPMA